MAPILESVGESPAGFVLASRGRDAPFLEPALSGGMSELSIRNGNRAGSMDFFQRVGDIVHVFARAQQQAMFQPHAL